MTDLITGFSVMFVISFLLALVNKQAARQSAKAACKYEQYDVNADYSKRGQ